MTENDLADREPPPDGEPRATGGPRAGRGHRADGEPADAVPSDAEPADAIPSAADGAHRLADMFTRQAEACAALGSPLYAAQLARAADDVLAGGPVARVLAGHEHTARRAALPLRLAGAVHALVLSGRAPDLAAYYPSAGGAYTDADADACWTAFRTVVADHETWIREWLTRPPQTNEPGRANLLIAGVLKALAATSPPAPAAPSPPPDGAPAPPAPSVRLVELGASAGLNLRADRFRVTAPGLAWGPPDSPVHLAGAWTDPPPWLTAAAAAYPRIDVAERLGCDPEPLDPSTPAGSLALLAYLWPDQPDRVARLAGALRLAAAVPAAVRRTGAADLLARLELRPGTLTVVWHSVMRQYVPPPEWARVERELARLAAASGPDAAFAHVFFEPVNMGDNRRPFVLGVRVGEGPLEYPAEAAPHGLPARVLGTRHGDHATATMQ